jgi:hypothetical protein
MFYLSPDPKHKPKGSFVPLAVYCEIIRKCKDLYHTPAFHMSGLPRALIVSFLIAVISESFEEEIIFLNKMFIFYQEHSRIMENWLLNVQNF